jgi:hypothetical protein
MTIWPTKFLSSELQSDLGDQLTALIRTALALAAHGWHIFPCLPGRKTPATPHGCLDATTDPAVIRTWWRKEPQFNVAAALGVPSKVFAVDIDGLDGEVELRRLEHEHAPLPSTVEVVTPRGRHIYFSMPEILVRNSEGKIAPQIDVRATGGYTLLPPSLHPSGRKYAWSVDSADKFASAPDWLLARVAKRNGAALPAAPSEWRAMLDGVPEGRRNSSLARIAGYLLRHSIDPVFAAGLLQIFNAARCAPPLPEKDVARIIDSIAGKELKRRQHG